MAANDTYSNYEARARLNQRNWIDDNGQWGPWRRLPMEMLPLWQEQVNLNPDTFEIREVPAQ